MTFRIEQTPTSRSQPESDHRAVLLRDLHEVRRLQESLHGAVDAEEKQLVRHALGKRQQIVGAIVEANIGMVRSIVRRVGRNSTASSADYEQEGIAALIEAAESYDPAKGAWSSWAYRKINSAVLGALHSTEFAHLTHREFAQRPELLRAMESLEQEHGKAVTSHDAALELGLEGQHVDRLVSGVTMTTTDHLTDEMPADEPFPGSVADAVDFSTLDAREVYVIHRRHLMANAPLREVAQELGVSDEQVRRIEQRALAKLQWGLPEQVDSDA